jgi:hypothetical protein
MVIALIGIVALVALCGWVLGGSRCASPAS